jgi:hypothetical protein
VVTSTISDIKKLELEARGTTGSTLLATTLGVALVIAQYSAAPRTDNEKRSIRLVGTESTVSLQQRKGHSFALAEQSIILGWRQALRDQLADVFQEASVRGWDGYDAEPIKQSAVDTAQYLIAVMPETIPHPDVVPSPNGEIAFEWDRSKNYVFSIRTHGRLLVYAGIFGTDRKQYGQEPIGQEFPRSISTILATYFSEA